jgi:hypothetical protein
LKQVQICVAAAEKALKLVSDTIGDDDLNTKKPEEVATTTAVAPAAVVEADGGAAPTAGGEKKIEPLIKDNSKRVLKGVMRVGALAKGLLLRGQLSVDLVVLCSECPTFTLLNKVGKLVPEKLKEAFPEDTYNTIVCSANCAIVISSVTEPKCTVKIVLTSPSMRDESEAGKKGDQDTPSIPKAESSPSVDTKDLILDLEKSLSALAALRRAKWFQARANQLASCVVTIRIMRDICSRVPAFQSLQSWPIELLCEKALASYYAPISVGEAFRRVLETLSSGIFLPGGSGLLDPCEKEKTDAIASMTCQEKENITAAAQQFLRLLAFRQLHKVLEIAPLQPVAKIQGKRLNSESAVTAAAANQEVGPSKVAKTSSE